jgi:hypothetical protein
MVGLLLRFRFAERNVHGPGPFLRRRARISIRGAAGLDKGKRACAGE